MRTRSILRTSLIACTALALLPLASVAAPNTAATPEQLALAAIVNANQYQSASYVTSPGTPAGSAGSNAVADEALAGMPSHGSTFMALTNGRGECASGASSSYFCAQSHGSTYKGAYDVTVLAVTVTVPSGHNHLGMEFVYLTEDYPEYIGSRYGDAAVAELDQHTWTSGPGGPSAPNNFAKDQNGNLLGSNSASLTSSAASGTNYSGATCRVTNWVAAAPGSHTLYFSIMDNGDASFDSALFVDAIRTASHAATPSPSCSTGPTVDPDTVYASASPNPGNTCKPTTFTATDDVPAPATYAWTFGDGASASGNPVSHEYAAAGTYTVTVTRTNTATNAVTSDTLSYQVLPCLVDLSDTITVGQGNEKVEVSYDVEVRPDGSVEASAECHVQYKPLGIHVKPEDCQTSAP